MEKNALGKGWLLGETIITGIGQGYIQTTPIQLCLMTAQIANGGFEMDADGEGVTDEYGQPIPTNTVVNGGHPIAVSVYRPFKRKDEKITGRINIDWDISQKIMICVYQLLQGTDRMVTILYSFQILQITIQRS